MNLSTTLTGTQQERFTANGTREQNVRLNHMSCHTRFDLFGKLDA